MYKKQLITITILSLLMPLSGNAEPSINLNLPYLDSETYRISRAYGIGYHRNKDFYALDFADSNKNPQKVYGKAVRATATGRISWVNRDKNASTYGINMEIDHENGLFSRYTHLSRVASKINQGGPIQQGEIVGFFGNTGYVEPKPTTVKPYQGTGPNFVVEY